MNVIVVVLWTSGATYRNSFKAPAFCSSRHVQQAPSLLRAWNTSRDMDDFINEGSPTSTEKWRRKNLKTEIVLKTVINRQLHIRIVTIFFKVFFLILSTLFQPFDPFFFNCFAKFSLGMWVKLFWICEWHTHHFRRTSLSGYASWLETTRNHIGRDLGCMLDAVSLKCRAALGTLEAVCGRAPLWWSIYHPTSSGHFHLMCPNNFSKMDT